MPSVTNQSGIRPVGYRVLILADEIEEVTPGGIVIPATEKEKMDQAQKTGTLVAIGNLAGEDQGEDWVKVGMRIIHNRYSGEHLTGVDGKMYRLMNDDQIWGEADDEVMLGVLDRYSKRQAYG